MEERLTVRIGANLSEFERKMSQMQGKMNDVGKSMSSIGSSMTKYITAPAAGAVAAAASITAAFGWKRLVGLDSAQAQLKGLGYEVKDVERISGQVKNAVQGTTMTMAEGTSVAAGALAAGVEEGAELEAYIKAVGNAAVGSGREVGEMASIFNRVQGSGKLMTQELNMIEDGMPGFAQAMADSLGVGMEEFRKMVTAGEVTSDQFLDVMDDFAGDMSEAYADSWQGMVANTKAWIGILGENLLSGVFEQSKDSIGEFMELLKSDAAQTWAKEMGAKISDGFGRVINAVKSVVNWWNGLSGTTKKVIGVFAGLTVALGPVLMFLGKMIPTFMGIVKVMGTVGDGVAKAGGVFKYLGVVLSPIMKFFAIFKPLLAALTGPIGLTVAGIAALGAGFVLAYKKSETFRNFIDGIKEKFSAAIGWISDFKDGIIGLFQGEGTKGVDILTSIGLSEGLVEKLFNISGYFLEFYHKVKDIIGKVITTISGIFEIFKGNQVKGSTMLMSIGLSPETVGMIFAAVGKIKYFFIDMGAVIKTALNTVGDFFEGVFTSISNWWNANGTVMLGNITSAFDTAKEILGTVFNSIKEAFSVAFTAIKEWWDSNGESIVGGIVTAFEWMKETVGLVFELIVSTIKFAFKVVQGVFETFAPIVTGIWNLLWDTITGTVELLVPVIIGLWDVLWNTIKGTIEILAPIITGIVRTAIDIIVEAFNYFAPIVMGIWNTVWPAIQLTLTNVWEIIKSVVKIGLDFVQSIIRTATAVMNGDWSKVWEEIKGFTSRTFETIKSLFSGMTKRATELISNMVGAVKQWFQDMWSNVTTKVTQIKNDVVNRFNELKNNAIQKVTEAYNSITTWFSNLWTNVTNKARDIKNGVTNRFTEMKDNAINGVKRLYDRTSELFNDVKTKATNTFDDMVEGAKALPGKIGSAIKNMAHKAVEGITSLGSKMGKKMESVVNSVIGGLNKVLKAIGVKEIGTISINAGGGTATGAAGYIRRYSTGTRNGAIASDTLGMVNDRGPGNGRGGATQELIQRDGQLFAPRGKNAIVPLKKGDRIFNGAETQSLMSSGVIPRFSQGTGAEGGNSGKKKGLFGTLKDVVSDVWSYISNPGKAFEAIISSVTSNFDGFDGFAGKMLSGGFKMVTDGIKNFIAKIFKENEGALGSGKAGNWMGYRMTTPYSPNRPVPGYPTGFNGGRHYGIDYGTPIGTPITATTGGQLSSFWNEGGGKIAKLVTGQLRQFFMHMQTVAPNGSVKAGDVIGRSGNSGRWTTGPHVHWQAQQGTDALNTNTIDPRKVIGHANGGIFSNQHVANFAEEGPEAIIPLSAKRRGRANNLYDSVGKAIGRDDGQQFRTMIDNQQKQIERMDKTINVLLGIEDKTGFEPGKAKKSIDRHIDDRAIIY